MKPQKENKQLKKSISKIDPKILEQIISSTEYLNKNRDLILRLCEHEIKYQEIKKTGINNFNLDIYQSYTIGKEYHQSNNSKENLTKELDIVKKLETNFCFYYKKIIDEYIETKIPSLNQYSSEIFYQAKANNLWDRTKLLITSRTPLSSSNLSVSREIDKHLSQFIDKVLYPIAREKNITITENNLREELSSKLLYFLNNQVFY